MNADDENVAIGTVAVIMSVYRNDQPHLVDRAIRSIFDQFDLKDWGVKLYLGVDGPVSDEILSIIGQYESDACSVHRFPENRGLPYVLNDLIALVDQEKYIFRMDADDACYPNRFSRQIEYMENNESVDILGSAICEVYDDGTQRTVFYPEDNETAVDNLYRRGPVAHPTVCFRKRVFDVVQGRYPCVVLSEDIALWFECAKAGLRFANLQEPLLYFTVGKNFWKRRGAMRARVELGVWLGGIWALHGLSWRLLWPPVRFFFRLSPMFVQKLGYASAFRKAKSQ